MARSPVQSRDDAISHDRAAKGYARARRHSRWVTFLKYLFPVGAVLAVAGFIGVTMLAQTLEVNIPIDNLTISGGKLIMNNPHMTGEASKSKAYSVSAARAIQELTNPNIVRLEEISANIEFSAEDDADLTAISGVYDREKNFLTLDQPFTIVTKSGMTAKFRYADVDIESGELRSDQHVIIDTEQAKITANRLVMTDNGAKITFEDDVQMTIEPSALKQNNKTSRTGTPKPTEQKVEAGQ